MIQAAARFDSAAFSKTAFVSERPLHSLSMKLKGQEVRGNEMAGLECRRWREEKPPSPQWRLASLCSLFLGPGGPAAGEAYLDS